MPEILVILSLFLSVLSSNAEAAGTLSLGPEQWRAEGWHKTNFKKKSVKFRSILSGGPGRDGIPPIYEPHFVSNKTASKWLNDSEPVIVVEQYGESRAYPLRILTWHEIVNDELGGHSFIVTFCPLCNAAVVYNTHFSGENHRFGVSGKLRNSDMVMWDHDTHSWWQQLTGEAIVGDSTGQILEPLPSQMIAFKTFKKLRPEGEVLSQETGHRRRYGENPYVRYDSGSPFFPVPSNSSGLRKMERVIGMVTKNARYALPMSAMKGRLSASLQAGDTELVVFNLSIANSALDGKLIANSKVIEHVTLFRNTTPHTLGKLKWQEGKLIDSESGIAWNALGEGFLDGKKRFQLEPEGSGVFFAFAWFGFYPDSKLLRVPE
jgi:hypothetical protein